MVDYSKHDKSDAEKDIMSHEDFPVGLTSIKELIPAALFVKLQQ